MAVDRLIWKICIDVIVLFCVLFPILALDLWATPFERGYFEDDMSIRLPYKEQQVSVAVLAIAGFAIAIVTVLVVEIVRDRRGKSIGEKFLSGAVIPGWVWESYTTIGIFTFGAGCQQVTSDLTKYVIGRLRPHFYDVCRPIPVAGSALNTLEYIQQYTCTGSRRELLEDARLSFPSSHSSFSMYCAVFIILYIQMKCKWRGSKLLRHGVQYVVLIAAWYVGLSRIVDHMHHWSDVTVGFAIGATYAVLVFIFVLKPKKYGLPTSWDEPVPAVTNPLPRVALVR